MQISIRFCLAATFLSFIVLWEHGNAVPMECVRDNSYLNWWDRSMDAQRSYYFLAGAYSYHHNHYEDRRWKWQYCRPSSPNTDWTQNESPRTLSWTNWDGSWKRTCGSNQVMTRAYSYHSDSREDRLFEFQCTKLQPHFKAPSCRWTGWLNSWDGVLSYQYGGTSSRVIRGVRSYHWSSKEDRKFKFYMCSLSEQKMLTKWSTASEMSGQRYFVSGVKSPYDEANAIRSFERVLYSTPYYYQPMSAAAQSGEAYPLTKTTSGSSFTRICTGNAAMTSLSMDSSDDSFEMECADLVDELEVNNCRWTDDFVNIFKETFSYECNDGALRGIQSYRSQISGDRRFKFYCCAIDRGEYSQGHEIDMAITIQATDVTDAESRPILLDLCWENKAYQAVIVPSASGEWLLSDESVEEHNTCGNQRAVEISNNADETVVIESIRITDDDAIYIIDSFCVHPDTGASCTSSTSLSIADTDSSTAGYKVSFPDDYLSSCLSTDASTGCEAEASTLADAHTYSMSIYPCATFTPTSEARFGIVIRGMKGNLEKVVLEGTSFSEHYAGVGDVGELLSIDMELEGDNDFCVQKVEISDPYSDGPRVFAQDYFADGIYFSSNCGVEYFKNLDDTIQYVPCVEDPFVLNTFQSNVYVSVQIHVCDGDDAGVTASSSSLMSMTISGTTKDNAVLNTKPLSLRSSKSFVAGESRDFTLPISGGFEEVTMATFSNNGNDALCVDNVLINGENAYLTHYWFGVDDSDRVLPVIPAVLKWPICNIELNTQITAQAELPTDPSSVATATCVNRNRLLEATCAIAQGFETFKEVSWEHESGSETFTSVSVSKGTSVAVEVNAFAQLGYDSSFAGLSVTKGEEFSAEVGSEEGTSVLDVTTNGLVNGEAISIECSGEITVGPNQQVQYALLLENSEVELTTLTDIKMTKCSAYLYGDTDSDAFNDPDNYIWIYGVKGTLKSKQSTNCYVSYNEAETANPEGITCEDEREMATRTWGGDYVPLCDESNPELYQPCQCTFKDAGLSPQCGCVDIATGNLQLDASVVEVDDDYAWQDWCLDHCYGNVTSAPTTAPSAGSVAADGAIDAIDIDEPVVEEAVPVEDNEKKTGVELNEKYVVDVAMVVVILVAVLVVLVLALIAMVGMNYMKAGRDTRGNGKHPYSRVDEIDTESELEKI